MPKIRGNTAEKWARRTASATQEYTEGVQNPRTPWKGAAQAAAANHTAGLQQAITNQSFAKGVAATPDGKWQEKAISKGAQRFGPGAQEAQGDYQKGFEPFKQVIENTVLPPRGAKGDPKNYQRVIAMGQALRAKKMGK
jgi:hypothetical protein